MKKAHLFLIFSIISYVIFADCSMALLLAEESVSDLRNKGYAAQHDGGNRGYIFGGLAGKTE